MELRAREHPSLAIMQEKYDYLINKIEALFDIRLTNLPLQEVLQIYNDIKTLMRESLSVKSKLVKCLIDNGSYNEAECVESDYAALRKRFNGKLALANALIADLGGDLVSDFDSNSVRSMGSSRVTCMSQDNIQDDLDQTSRAEVQATQTGILPVISEETTSVSSIHGFISGPSLSSPNLVNLKSVPSLQTSSRVASFIADSLSLHSPDPVNPIDSSSTMHSSFPSTVPLCSSAITCSSSVAANVSLPSGWNSRVPITVPQITPAPPFISRASTGILSPSVAPAAVSLPPVEHGYAAVNDYCSPSVKFCTSQQGASSLPTGTNVCVSTVNAPPVASSSNILTSRLVHSAGIPATSAALSPPFIPFKSNFNSLSFGSDHMPNVSGEVPLAPPLPFSVAFQSTAPPRPEATCPTPAPPGFHGPSAPYWRAQQMGTDVQRSVNPLVSGQYNQPGPRYGTPPTISGTPGAPMHPSHFGFPHSVQPIFPGAHGNTIIEPIHQCNTNVSDAVSHHLVTQGLFRKSDDPYNGEPHLFYSWISNVKAEIHGLNLNASEIIRVLAARTTGEPGRVIKELTTMRSASSELKLQTIWEQLYKRFGSDAVVGSSLLRKLDAFPAIKNMNSKTEIMKLLDLCRLILHSLDYSAELVVLNVGSGQRKIFSKFPESFRRRWRTFARNYAAQTGYQVPPFAYVVQFLQAEVDAISDPCHDYSSELPSSSVTKKPVPTVKAYQTEKVEFSAPKQTCIYHEGGNHTLLECNKFSKLSFSEKHKFAMDHKLCFACLGPHTSSKCNSTVICTKCKGKHITLMHRDRPLSNANNQEQPAASSNYSGSSYCTAVCGNKFETKTCLKIVLVDVGLPSSSKVLRCYAMLDEQSTSSFVDQKLLDFFSVQTPLEEYCLNTLSGTSTVVQGRSITDLHVRGVGEDRTFLLPKLLTSDCIPSSKDGIASPSIVRSYPHMAHLADNFYEVDPKAEVLMLLGLDADEALSSYSSSTSPPFVHHTALGWALVGSVCPLKQPLSPKMTLLTVLDHEHFSTKPVFPNREVHSRTSLLRDPFHVAPGDELTGPSREDLQFLDTVSTGIHVNDSGHIAMPLPFRSAIVRLPNNCSAVFQRTKNTLTRLKKDKDKLNQCIESMQKTISSDYVELVPASELTPAEGKAWWLPVFPVTHPKKGKVRLVFDGSAVYSGVSINQQLLQGPDHNNRLRGVLLRFRAGLVGFAADIESMFHNFHLNPEDKDFFRFFWFKDNNPSHEIVQYRAKSHIFGSTSSPAIANFGLRFTTKHPDADDHPEAKRFIQENVYVDDGLGAADNPQDAISTLHGATQILKKYKIRLHKFLSNSIEVMQAFPSSERADASQILEFDDGAVHRTLGVAWDVKDDCFVIRVDIPYKPFTKRGVLAVTNSLYDPIGFLSPVVLGGRLIQRSVIPPKSISAEDYERGWDDPLPETHLHLWLNWKASLSQADSLKLPRSLYSSDSKNILRQELHVFGDASDNAIGYVAYLRTIDHCDKVHVAFVTANSKVSPRAATSIPRLELCAALEATQASTELIFELASKPTSVTLYSDSTVVLGYLHNTERRFSRYVTGRVNIIVSSFPQSHWRYIRSEDNPADIASRPHDPTTLSQTCWLRGPSFLWSDELPSKEDLLTDSPGKLPEEKDPDLSVYVTSENVVGFSDDILSSFRNWNTAVRTTQLMFSRWFSLVDRRRIRKNYSLAIRNPDFPAEMAKSILIRCAQRAHFDREIKTLHNLETLNDDHPLNSLSPFLDESGILRVGGRLKLSATLSFGQKCPIILPYGSPLSEMIVQHFHRLVEHQGRHLTHGAVAQAGFFLQKGSALIRSIVGKCVICKRLRAPFEMQKMADLPSDRIEESPPFRNCGMDVFGPFQVSEGVNTRRSISTKKAWGLLFTCLVSRAVHIELLPSLDTPSFINAYRRFVCVRGPCQRLRSDHGTNFVGAHNQTSLPVDSLKLELKNRNCEWVFNPPGASHQGGVWERKIGAVRRILEASMLRLGNRLLSRDELNTLLQEAASIINHTPLWSVSSSPLDPLPLTPAMLLTQKNDVGESPVDEVSDTDILAYGGRRWRRVQAVAEDFWCRWRQHYLQGLQFRKKWQKVKRNVSPGDLVLLRNKNAKRNEWPMGKVLDVKRSPDNLVRSLTVSTVDSSGARHSYERSICDVIVLLRSD